jgi:hypothetical protein
MLDVSSKISRLVRVSRSFICHNFLNRSLNGDVSFKFESFEVSLDDQVTEVIVSGKPVAEEQAKGLRTNARASH